MGHKDDEKKIGAVDSSRSTSGVKATESLSEVDKVKGAAAVRGVSGIAGINKAGSVGAVSVEQRERIMSIISEEAQKLTTHGVISSRQRELVEEAVKMAIDAALIEAVENKKR